MKTLSPRRGTVVGVPGNGTAVVNIGTGSVIGSLTDATATVSVGAQVTLLPLDGSYEVISMRTGGQSGPIYGPELVPNGGFEFVGSDGQPAGWQLLWNFNDPNPFQVVGDAPPEGSKLLQVRAASEDNHDAMGWVGAFRIDPGERYRLDLWARVDGTPPSNYAFSFGVITGSTQAKAAPLVEGSQTYQMGSGALTGANQAYGGEFVATSTDSWATPFFRTAATTRATYQVYLDAVSLRRRLN